MSQYIPDLDEPFNEPSSPDASPLPFNLTTLRPIALGDEDIEELVDPREVISNFATIVETPAGQEIVMAEVFEEPTMVYNQVELAALLADACPHRHTTVRSMHAVRPIE